MLVKVITFCLGSDGSWHFNGSIPCMHLSYQLVLHLRFFCLCKKKKLHGLCFSGVLWSVWRTWEGQQWGTASLSACCAERLWGYWELLQSSALTAARYNTTTSLSTLSPCCRLVRYQNSQYFYMFLVFGDKSRTYSRETEMCLCVAEQEGVGWLLSHTVISYKMKTMCMKPKNLKMAFSERVWHLLIRKRKFDWQGRSIY